MLKLIKIIEYLATIQRFQSKLPASTILYTFRTFQYTLSIGKIQFIKMKKIKLILPIIVFLFSNICFTLKVNNFQKCEVNSEMTRMGNFVCYMMSMSEVNGNLSHIAALVC